MLFVNIDIPMYMITEIKKKEKEKGFDFSNWVVQRFHKDFLDEELLTNYTKKNIEEAKEIINL